MSVSESDAKAIFNSFDVDKSGSIDAKELVACLSQLYGKDQAVPMAQVGLLNLNKVYFY
jgi:Ca2+-binding EF-hand superfamily protein